LRERGCHTERCSIQHDEWNKKSNKENKNKVKKGIELKVVIKEKMEIVNREISEKKLINEKRKTLNNPEVI
jgi:hypothetical protein